MLKEIPKKFYRGVKDVARLIGSGFSQVSDETYKERLKICEGCEFLDKKLWQCGKCLCFMTVKAKFAEMECPEKKWGRIPLETLPVNTNSDGCGCDSKNPNQQHEISKPV